MMKLEDIFNKNGNIIIVESGDEFITFKGVGVSDDIDEGNLCPRQYDHNLHHKYNSRNSIKKILSCDEKTVLYDNSYFHIGDVIEIDNYRYVITGVDYEKGLYTVMNKLGLTKNISHDISAFLIKSATDEQIKFMNTYEKIIKNLLSE